MRNVAIPRKSMPTAPRREFEHRRAFREKVKSDRQRLKDKLGERKEAYRAFFADADDEARQLGAAIAIDYAIATVQQARFAVLDAVSDRAEARTAQTQPVG